MTVVHDHPACAIFRGGKCTCDEADKLCPRCGSEEWDRITDKTAPGAAFNRCNRCDNEWPPVSTRTRTALNTACKPPEFPEFVGWMLWNMVGGPGVFEDQPAIVQAAWNSAASELQRRAKSLGRLM